MIKLWIGVAGTLALFGVVVKFFNKTPSVISKQQTIRILKQMRQRMFPIHVQIAMFVYENNLSHKQLDNVRSTIFKVKTNLQANIQSVILQICQSTKEEQLQYAIEQVYQNDLEVQFHKNEFQTQFINCLKGKIPEVDYKNAILFRKQQLLRVVEDILKNKVTRLKQLVKKVPNLQQALMQDQKIDDQIRNQQLRKLGMLPKNFIQFPKIIHKCCDMDKQFSLMYNEILHQYNQAIDMMQLN